MKHSIISALFFAFLTLSLLTGCSDGSGEITPDRESKRLSLAKVWKTENSHCEVQGNPANWQGAFCMWLNKTTDFKADEVQNCYQLASKRQGIPTQTCDRNRYFKREICKTLVIDHIFIGSLDDCLRSDDAVPVAVREGL